jgi:DNA mismatch endonuclease (patch repair protein)
MDTFTQEERSRIMRAVKGKDTTLEKKVCSALWRSGLRFRKHLSSLPGKPDIVFTRRRLAVFIDSCFWHGCSSHLRMPKSNLDYWKAKIERNKARDKATTQKLESDGWLVLRFWEHEVREDLERCLSKVRSLMDKENSK